MNGRKLRSTHRNRAGDPTPRRTRPSDTVTQARKPHQRPHTTRLDPGPYRLGALKLRLPLYFEDFMALSMRELRIQAKERGIKITKTTKKADLAKTVSEHRHTRLQRSQGR